MIMTKNSQNIFTKTHLNAIQSGSADSVIQSVFSGFLEVSQSGRQQRVCLTMQDNIKLH